MSTSDKSDDLRLLAAVIAVDSAETAPRICVGFFPGEKTEPRSSAGLRDLFGHTDKRAAQLHSPAVRAMGECP